jgi:hypothetical protein
MWQALVVEMSEKPAVGMELLAASFEFHCRRAQIPKGDTAISVDQEFSYTVAWIFFKEANNLQRCNRWRLSY